MKHKKDAIELANKVIKLHMENGLSEKDAKNSAIVTFLYSVNTGVFPAYESVNQRAYNYLKGEPFPQTRKQND